MSDSSDFTQNEDDEVFRQIAEVEEEIALNHENVKRKAKEAISKARLDSEKLILEKEAKLHDIQSIPHIPSQQFNLEENSPETSISEKIKSRLIKLADKIFETAIDVNREKIK